MSLPANKAVMTEPCAVKQLLIASPLGPFPLVVQEPPNSSRCAECSCTYSLSSASEFSSGLRSEARLRAERSCLRRVLVGCCLHRSFGVMHSLGIRRLCFQRRAGQNLRNRFSNRQALVREESRRNREDQIQAITRRAGQRKCVLRRSNLRRRSQTTDLCTCTTRFVVAIILLCTLLVCHTITRYVIQ